PAIARAIETDTDRGRRGVAWMYGINTLGAVCGAALSSFYMLEHFGARLSLFVTCGANLAIGLAARAASRAQVWQKLSAPPTAAEPRPAIDEADIEPLAPPLLVFASAAIVGFAFFLMELVWYRMLGPLLGGTVFTFGLILAVALAGIGLGSTAYALRFAARRPSLIGFAITCALEAACIAQPYALGDRVSLWALYLRPLGNLGFFGLLFGWWAIALIVVFPAALVAGFQFPMLIALLGGGRKHVGRHVGTAYAANTLGAIAGALAGGFGLIPALGALGCWKLASLTLAAWGVGVGIFAVVRSRVFVLGAIVLVLAGLSVRSAYAPGPSAAWRHAPIGVGRVPIDAMITRNDVRAFLQQTRGSVQWETDGIESAIGIGVYDGIGFIVNGKSDGNARSDAPTQVMGGLLGAALLPRVNKAMVIGLGTGSTAGWLGALPEIQRVDVAEIEPMIRFVAEVCTPVNNDVLHNPKVHIQRGDARELLAVSRERYDLIFSEPSNPYRAGVASLYTREFYQAVAQRLDQDGVFVQWLQAYDVDSQTLRTVYATLSSVFPHVETWDGMRHDLFLVASRQPLSHDAEQLRARVRSPVIARGMSVAWHTADLEGFLSHYVASPSFSRLAASSGGAIATDDLSPVEFGFARNVRGEPRAAAESLYEAIHERGENRPVLRGNPQLDWNRIDFEREAFGLLMGAPPSPGGMQPEYMSRLEVLRRWQSADFQGALAMWSYIATQAGGKAPVPIPIEQLALAEILAYQGQQPEFDAAVQAVATEQPTLAAAMRGVWLLNHGLHREGVDALTQALVQYRSDPWPLPGQMTRVLAHLQAMAPADPERVPHWVQTLSAPFSVFVNESARVRTRINIAFTLGPQNPVCIEVFGAMEPYVPWMEAVLDYRAKCYQAHGNALKETAAADLARFQGR
ncbi:MAG TPA: fused MFS/spermidine synthase, partial [Polyangiales bacterium]|nr:fused MFS/spermidine synthase [Polyangiales bacterium]